MTDLVPLERVPAILQAERARLATITTPAEAVDAEKRAAAIAELTRRAGLAVPVQNEATFLRAEALALLAQLVDAGEKPKGRPRKNAPKSGAFPREESITRRISEGRKLAASGAIDEARREAAEAPDEPVSMSDILRRATRREREQNLRAERVAREQQARREIQEAAEPPYAVHHADVAEWRPAPVDAIVTDPPYIGDSIPLYEALRDFAADTLKPGGPLVVMTWQAILPDVIRALEHPQLAYRWCLCWRYANVENTADQKRRVFDCWKPILVYHHGGMPADAPMVRDEIASRAGDKDYHSWGQSLDGFERLIRSFSRPGDIVCDPFLGGGTTAVAAIAQARRFVGCDVDEAAVNTTLERLAA